MMITAAQILKQKRSQKGYTLEEVSLKTKIPLRYLKLIEQGNYQSLPDESYTKLYVRDYASFLELMPDEVASFLRRDLTTEQSGDNRRFRRNRQNFAEPFLKRFSKIKEGISIEPNAAKIAGLVGIAIMLVAYLIKQYLVFNSPPFLSANLYCKKEQEMSVLVEGKTSRGATVFIGEDPVRVDKEGAFRSSIALPTGSSSIIIRSQSPIGKTTEITRTINCSL